MKRILIPILVFCLAFAPSCAEKSEHWTPSFPCTLTGQLSTKDISLCVTVVVSDTDRVDIAIDSPETLSGYSFRIEPKKTGVYYDGMEISLPDSFYPPLAIAEMLSVSREDFSYSREKDGERIDFFVKEGAEISVYTPKDTKDPRLIKYSAQDLDIDLEISSYSAEN